MIKFLLILFVLGNSVFAYAFSNVGHDTGIAQIVVKDGSPCFYLKDNKKISHIRIRELNGNTILDKNIIHPYLLDKEHCFLYGKDNSQKFNYDTPYVATLYDDSRTPEKYHHHLIKFCLVMSSDNKSKLVKVRDIPFWRFWDNRVAECTNNQLIRDAS